ncbi:hypothetical protein [Nonomuraea aurantiaca]|uniref:hypothetical protein n=1 Tax=Nonomuraea aurantiaca TaxID=2878562 RepID=UPI0035572A8B
MSSAASLLSVVGRAVFAAASWARRRACGRADPADDPRWPASGARTRVEYGRWCRHACGMACLQMALDHRDGHAPPLQELLHGCRAYGGYVEHDDGRIKGLYYAPFADYVRAAHRRRAGRR